MLLLSLAAEDIYSLLIVPTGRAAFVCGSRSGLQTLLHPQELGNYYPSRPSPGFLAEGGAVGSGGAIRERWALPHGGTVRGSCVAKSPPMMAACDAAAPGGWDRVMGRTVPSRRRVLGDPHTAAPCPRSPEQHRWAPNSVPELPVKAPPWGLPPGERLPVPRLSCRSWSRMPWPCRSGSLPLAPVMGRALLIPTTS